LSFFFRYFWIVGQPPKDINVNVEKGRNYKMQMFCYYCLQEGHLASHCPLRAQERTSEAIEKLGHQSLQSIDKIVSAQRDVAERVVDIGSEISGEISGAIYELADTFRFAHAEEMWYAEKQLDVLIGIREAIQYSETITKANALFEMALSNFPVKSLYPQVLP